MTEMKTLNVSESLRQRVKDRAHKNRETMLVTTAQLLDFALNHPSPQRIQT